MPEKYLTRNVKRETDVHYKGGWPVHADARRFLYLKYAEYPEKLANIRGEEQAYHAPRDIWREVAKEVTGRFGEGRDMLGLDVGSSSGYFIEQLLEEGYKGAIVGIDIESGHQQFLQDNLADRFKDANILLGRGNAMDLKRIQLRDDEDKTVNSLRIRANSVDFLTGLFVLYHVPDYRAAYKAAHRVLKPDGLAIFSGRGTMNQLHLWNLGAIIAQDYDVRAPESFYSHHDIKAMQQYLEESSRFELQSVVPQANHIWIPTTGEEGEEGWAATKHALASLPFGPDKRTGKSIVNAQFFSYLDDVIKPHFDMQGAANDGYFIDYVFQNYYVCRAIK